MLCLDKVFRPFKCPSGYGGYGDEYRIKSIVETVEGSCTFTSGDTCVATSTVLASTVNAAGAESFTWSGYVEGATRPYEEDGTMITDVDGKRYLQDVGDAPATDTVSNNGQGLKFNGVDQNISLFEVVANDSYTMIADNGATRVCSLDNNLFNNGNVVAYFNGEGGYVTIDSVPTGIRAIVCRPTEFDIYVNGLLFKTESVPLGYSQTVYPDIGKRNTFYTEGIVSNYIFIKGNLTPTQIAYQFNNPEKFLYRQNNILKSDILTQGEIDNVVAYLPLCENDGYCRDLVGYSEGSEEVTNGTFDTNLDGWSVAATSRGTYSWDSGRAKIINNGADSYPNITTYVACTIGSTYKISFSADMGTADAVELRLVDGVSGNVNYQVTESGNYEVIWECQATDNYLILLYLWETGNTGHDCWFDNISIKELSATYPITNYLDTMRTNAENLDTGLQTSSLVRDSLGVPIDIPHGTNHREGQIFETGMTITAPYTAVEYCIKDGVTTKYVLVDDGSTQTLFIDNAVGKPGVAIHNPVVFKGFSLLNLTDEIDERILFAYSDTLANITSGQGTKQITVASDADEDISIHLTCEAFDTVTTLEKTKNIIQEHTLAP